MCGILGFHGNCTQESFLSSLQELEHRGPDNTSIAVLDQNCKVNIYSPNSKFNLSDLTLAHTRLSIIDLDTTANQPFIKYDKILIYNGEIFNYIELKKELKDLGYSFSTSSDTEVLISAYDAWGKDCLQKLNGMWAFTIYDIQKKKLFLARDRFGIKPLYYSFDNDTFSFSSEIKSLIKLSSVSKNINYEQVKHYLFWGLQEVEKETMFKGIFKLLPGHIIEYSLKEPKVSQKQYYDIYDVQEDREKDFDSSLKSLSESFQNSVKLRMRSDVPVGLCLSGGLDSSSILLEANKRIKTYSIVYDQENQEIDESPWIDSAVDKFQVENKKFIPTYEDLIENLEDFVYTYDEPITGTSVFAQWFLMKKIHEEDIKVVLDGQGGDEVFGGYLYSILFSNNTLNNLYKSKSNASMSFLLKSYLYAFFPNLYEKLLSKKISKQLKYSGKIPKNLNKTFRYKISVNNLLKSELTSGLRVLLKYADRSSMRFSIESRLPYLDYRLVEGAFRLPSTYKVKNGWTRYLQRKMFDKRLDDKLVWRRKKLGFPTPESKWINQLKKEKKVKKYLESSKILKNLKIDHNNINNLNLYWRAVNISVWEKMLDVD